MTTFENNKKFYQNWINTVNIADMAMAGLGGIAVILSRGRISQRIGVSENRIMYYGMFNLGYASLLEFNHFWRKDSRAAALTVGLVNTEMAGLAVGLHFALTNPILKSINIGLGVGSACLADVSLYPTYKLLREQEKEREAKDLEEKKN